MAENQSEYTDLSRSGQKKIDKLIEILTRIQAAGEPNPVRLGKFQQQYLELSRGEQIGFFDALLRRLEVEKIEIAEPMRAVLASNPDDAINWSRLVTAARRALESPRMRAFRRFLSVSGGFKFLLDLRSDVITAGRQTSLDLDPLDEELAHLFNSWFQHGFLFLQEVTRDSSFRQIRFLKDHDMVHPTASLDEMGNRLGEDRRCFALYHRAMPEEPVVFIEAALTRGIARSIHDILREDDAPLGTNTQPDTAIFYSINNTQNGLAGLGLGKVLIFQVVDAIKRADPRIKTFSTLSPITGFWPRYLKPILEGRDQPYEMTLERVEKAFPAKEKRSLSDYFTEKTGRSPFDFRSVLLHILSSRNWLDDPILSAHLQRPLTEITYFYVTQERNRDGKPINPVANFHMGNGATVTRKNINFGANRSDRGLADSCGMMVNYVYSRTWLQQIGRSMKSWLSWNT
jgi:hypothetical protein